MSEKKLVCRTCGEEIALVYDYATKKEKKVEPFVLDASDRQLERQKQKIPYDTARHYPHLCKLTDEENAGVYRGGD